MFISFHIINMITQRLLICYKFMYRRFKFDGIESRWCTPDIKRREGRNSFQGRADGSPCCRIKRVVAGYLSERQSRCQASLIVNLKSLKSRPMANINCYMSPGWAGVVQYML